MRFQSLRRGRGPPHQRQGRQSRAFVVVFRSLWLDSPPNLLPQEGAQARAICFNGAGFAGGTPGADRWGAMPFVPERHPPVYHSDEGEAMRISLGLVLMCLAFLAHASVCSDYRSSLTELISYLDSHRSSASFGENTAPYTVLENRLALHRQSAINEYQRMHGALPASLLRAIEASQSSWAASKRSIEQSQPLLVNVLELLGANASVIGIVPPDNWETINTATSNVQKSAAATMEAAFAAFLDARISFETLSFFSVCEQGGRS